MRRPSIDALVGAVVAIALGLQGCAATRDPDRLDPLGLLPPPPTISAAEAADHVGELVVVRTRIGSARVEQGRAVLEPAGVPAGGFTIAIAPPMVGPTARELVDRYRGQEVRAVGYVSALGGGLEMLIGDPSRVRLAGLADEAGARAAATPPDESVRPQGTPPAASAPVQGSPPAASAPAPGRASTEAACANARAAWRAAARQAQEPLRAMLRCLQEENLPCETVSARARVALAEVAASEERLRWLCGGGS